MSTKAAKKQGSVPAEAQKKEATSSANAGNNAQNDAPSPTKQTRLQEKFDLQNLNDRLAAYIDRVRELELENNRLRSETQVSEEIITREKTNLKNTYESEVNDLRRSLDDTSRERAKLEIDTKRLWEENADLKERYERKTKDLTHAENQVRVLESRVGDLQAKYAQAQADRKKVVDELKDAQKNIELLRKQVDELRRSVEDETLLRVEIENQAQSLREALAFKEEVHAQEITEIRTRRQSEVTEIDGRLASQYEARMQESLQALRDQYEAHMEANRDEIEALYEAKVNNLEQAASRSNEAFRAALDEAKQFSERNETLYARIRELEAINGQLQTRVHELEKQLQDDSLKNSNNVMRMEQEMKLLREEMSQQIKEYNDLMDAKLALDVEISTYRALLESEENRLNITPSSAQIASESSMSRRTRTPVRRNTPSRLGQKRKRGVFEEHEERQLGTYNVQSTSKGDIEIVDVCADGKYVKLLNKSNKEISLSGWQLVRRAGGDETLFKFHRTVKLDGGATTTVWSADSNVNHEPPANIVMKGQKWFVADNMATLLLNSSGDEVALHERERAQLSTTRSRELYGREEFLSQPGEPPRGENGEKCTIM